MSHYEDPERVHFPTCFPFIHISKVCFITTHPSLSLHLAEALVARASQSPEQRQA
jgi:hypothetical protein